jgi:hypothetical protein
MTLSRRAATTLACDSKGPLEVALLEWMLRTLVSQTSSDHTPVGVLRLYAPAPDVFLTYRTNLVIPALVIFSRLYIGFRLPTPSNDQYRPKYSLRFQMLGIFTGGRLPPQMTDPTSIRGRYRIAPQM